MNIRRGLFRVWIVFSALWVLGVILFSYSDVSTAVKQWDEDRGIYARINGPNLQLLLDSEKKGTLKPWDQAVLLQARERHWIADLPDPERDKVANPMNGLPQGYIMENVLQGFPWDLIFGKIFFVILLPAVTLATWFISSWVLAGFRSKKPTQNI